MLLSTEVGSRESHGGEHRVRFGARKALEEFDFTFQRLIKPTVIEHLGQFDFLHGKDNVIMPGLARTGLPGGPQGCLRGHDAGAGPELAEARRQGSLEAELRRLSHVPLLTVDEVGYVPSIPKWRVSLQPDLTPT